ncbi:MAG: hypothetical protein V4723_21145 [Pseudomonadota bacterium]
METQHEQQSTQLAAANKIYIAHPAHVSDEIVSSATPYPVRMGKISGLVSAGFGIVQLVAPRSFARLIGMAFPPWVIRTVGVRDLALGIAMLSRPGTPAWRQARLVNDMLDTGLNCGGSADAGKR